MCKSEGEGEGEDEQCVRVGSVRLKVSSVCEDEGEGEGERVWR